MSALDIVLSSRLVAIIRMEDLSIAKELTQALLAGGVRAIEFTLTNRDALHVVPHLIQACPEFRSGGATIGIGSVRNLSEAQAALAAGAQFIVSPITRHDIIQACNAAKVPCMPGAMTPTEIASAWDAGASIVKLFPAKGLLPSYVRDVLAPMPYLKLMPTGGVDRTNLENYFRAGAVAVGIGNHLLDTQALKERDWDKITAGAADFMSAVQHASNFLPS